MRVNTLSPAPQLALALLVTACGDPGPSTRQAAPVAADAASAPAPAPAPASPTTLAQVKGDVPMPLSRLLGRTIAEVQAELGEHTGKGMARKSCYRFVPERVIFTCEYAMQSYLDKTDTFSSIRVGYEDGVATEVAFDGWKHGSGAFTPEALLSAIGLTLPEPGKESAPADKVRLWSWFNSQARLVLGGKQHRVEVSIVEDDWKRSRIEVLLNHPLSAEQKARVVTPGGEAPPAQP